MFSNQVALIAEDALQVQRILVRILKEDLKFGKVLVASNGKEAMQFFENEHVDWIFSDWDMPEMTGDEFIQALRLHPRGKDVPFILMSGRTHADKESLVAAVKLGVNDFVVKPFSPAVLAQKIQRINTATKRAIAARIAPKGHYPAQILFPSGTKYEAELVDISATGCLLRTKPLQQGGTVFDEAELTIKLIANTVSMKSLTARIAMDNIKEVKSPERTVLVAFQYKAEEELLNSIKLFISQEQVKESETSGGVTNSDNFSALKNDWA